MSMRVHRKHYTDRHGRSRTVSKWYVEFSDHLGTTQQVPGFSDKAATRELGRRLEKLSALRAAGQPPDPELSAWIERCSSGLRSRLLRLRLVEPEQLAGSCPLKQHLEDFRDSLLAKGNTAGHAQQSYRRAKRVVDGCGFRYWTDVRPHGVETLLRDLREGGLGRRTSNYLLQAARQFCRWMVSRGRAAEDPLRALKPLNADVEPRRQRQALSAADQRRLVEVTLRAPERHGMSGSERSMLYRLGLETGLRANELRQLRVRNFELDASPPQVHVHAADSKRRRHDTVPLRQETAADLRRFMADRLPIAPAFAIPRSWRPAQMLRADLADAKLPYEDELGRFMDFHALRHTFITTLARQDVPPKVVQRLARHSTITLTFDRYTHLRPEDETRALSALPDLSSSTEQSVATGTDGGGDLPLGLPQAGGSPYSAVTPNAASLHSEADPPPGEVAKSVDASDLKSEGPRAVGVRLPPSPPPREIAKCRIERWLRRLSLRSVALLSHCLARHRTVSCPEWWHILRSTKSDWS